MDRYTWKENEMHIIDSFCQLCCHAISDSSTSCEKYEQIPEDVAKCVVRCPFFKKRGGSILDELKNKMK